MELIRQLKGKHKQTQLQWIPENCQITGKEQAGVLSKKGAKITQTYIRETPYRSLNHLTPNDPYSGLTAPLTSKVAFYIFI